MNSAKPVTPLPKTQLNNRFATKTELNNDSIMSCLEHQRLYQSDFKHSADFDYLIEHELPCFTIEIKHGQLSLLVGHYLAKIILPSGLPLEILPKITAVNSGSTADDVSRARQWVATMLTDIGSDQLAKTIKAINLSASHSSPSHNLYSQEYEVFRIPPLLSKINGQADESLSVAINKSSDKLLNHLKNKPWTESGNRLKNQPWYEGLLATIREQLQLAASLLPNRYQTQINNRPKAQGKINLSKQLKSNWHRPHYLYTEQSVFDNDKLLAQFLATAWQKLQSLTESKATKPVLSTPISLQGIMVLPPQQWAAAYQQLQKNKSIWATQFSVIQANMIGLGIEWAWWILSQNKQQYPLQNQQHHQLKQQQNQHQGLPTSALMINMNHAFERWVLGKLQNWVSKNLASSRLVIHPSFDWLCLQDSRLKSTPQSRVVQKLIPDACIVTEQGLISHVIDIKYKGLQAINQISGSDWQQLYVYQHHLQCQNAWLIYPKTRNFEQRLDVLANLEENRLSNQHHDIENKTSSNKAAQIESLRQMSVIPFDPLQSLLLL